MFTVSLGSTVLCRTTELWQCLVSVKSKCQVQFSLRTIRGWRQTDYNTVFSKGKRPNSLRKENTWVWLKYPANVLSGKFQAYDLRVFTWQQYKKTGRIFLGIFEYRHYKHYSHLSVTTKKHARPVDGDAC